MNQLAHTIGSALLLEDSAYVEMRDAEDGFRRGLLFLVVISLVVGLIISLVSFINAVQTTPAQAMAQFQQAMEQALQQMRAFGAFGGDEAFWQAFTENWEAGLALGARITQVVEETTPAPKPVVDLFHALGQWASYPFGWISTWMLYGLLTLVFAKLLGGTASIQEMLAATSLVALPHLLDAFRFIPFVGFLISIIAFLWGVAIYVKGTAVANRLDVGRALLAVAAPILVLLALLTFLLLLVLILLIIATA